MPCMKTRHRLHIQQVAQAWALHLTSLTYLKSCCGWMSNTVPALYWFGLQPCLSWSWERPAACSLCSAHRSVGKACFEIWPPPGDQNGNWAIQLLFGGRLSFMLTQLQFMGPRGEQAGSTEAAFTNKLSVPKGEVFTAITAPYLCVARFSLHLHLDLLLCY